jgi:hypothetical protein
VFGCVVGFVQLFYQLEFLRNTTTDVFEVILIFLCSKVDFDHRAIRRLQVSVDNGRAKVLLPAFGQWGLGAA